MDLKGIVQVAQLYLVFLSLSAIGMTITPVVFAQDADLPLEAEATSESQRIEQITVIGERTTYSIRMELESAETEMYALFNEINSNDEYDVTCTEELFLGSFLPKRVCMSEFLRREQARNSRNVIDGTDLALNLNGLKDEVRGKFLAMEAEMLQLAEENKSFGDALLRLGELMAILEAR